MSSEKEATWTRWVIVLAILLAQWIFYLSFIVPSYLRGGLPSNWLTIVEVLLIVSLVTTLVCTSSSENTVLNPLGGAVLARFYYCCLGIYNVMPRWLSSLNPFSDVSLANNIIVGGAPLPILERSLLDNYRSRTDRFRHIGAFAWL